MNCPYYLELSDNFILIKFRPGDEHITAEINEKLEALSKLVQENEQKDQIATSSQQASENVCNLFKKFRIFLSFGQLRKSFLAFIV